MEEAQRPTATEYNYQAESGGMNSKNPLTESHLPTLNSSLNLKDDPNQLQTDHCPQIAPKMKKTAEPIRTGPK